MFFWNNLHQVPQIHNIRKPNNIKVCGGMKLKELKQDDQKLEWSHLCLREDNLSFNNHYIIKGL